MVEWSDLTLAILGGDEREPEIARLAATTGATVRGYGFPWPQTGVEGVERAASAEESMTGAHYALLPIPRGEGSYLYAPAAPSPILVEPSLFAVLAPGAHAFCGRATDVLKAAARPSKTNLHEYDPDQELMLQRAPAIVEGALQLTIQHTDVTINGADVAVVGFGNIGSLLARRLIGLGARVYVAARNPIQRAAAEANGARPLPLDRLPRLAPRLSMLFSTVPARVVGREVLERLPPGSLVLDVAPPPDHADLQLAKQLGHRVVWARGLGSRAPLTVGRSQWAGVRSRIEALETAKRAGGSDRRPGNRNTGRRAP